MSNGNKKLNQFFSNNIFIGSFNGAQNIPNEDLPECCFIGRSNVGKSSILNAITKTKNLAKTSKTPGRTQLINLFEISKLINIVDLPGYGYAKVPLIIKEKLSYLIESYLISRSNLTKIFLLIDCKVGIKNSDLDMIDYIKISEKEFSIILTKSDKCSINIKNQQIKNINSLLKVFDKNSLNIHLTSSKNHEGITDIQKEIFNLKKTNEI